MAESEPVHINSFVILDLETTGLPCFQFRTKITEISILGIERSHILQSFREKKFLPRVVQKLNLCVYPNRLVNTHSSEVSGLSNDVLENCKRFDEDVFDVLLKVIKFLPPPVCLLAHNGNSFDYPILRSEIAHIGKAFPDDIYCADTLPAFRKFLYHNGTSELQNDIAPLDGVNLCELNLTTEFDETDLGIDIPPDDIHEVNDVAECSSTTQWGSEGWDQALTSATEEAEKKFIHEVEHINMDEIKRINETTPTRKTRRVVERNNKLANGHDKVKDSRKVLFPDKSVMAFKRRYRLQDCYKHLTGKYIVNAHRADSDTHALLECVVAVGPSLLEWIDNNCKSFNTIKKLW